jgi:hypothetical protein
MEAKLKEYFWFYLLETILFLYFIIVAMKRYLKWRAKYDLVMLITIVIIFIGIILSYFYQGKLIPGIAKEIQFSVIILLIISFWIFLFYPRIKEYLERRKNKKDNFS